ncbi:uncharacterized protein LOC116162670 [Photinus pyralis]|uniref:uncharacterized protein LOC116162670 n=1 Tax=Photinus pyralis TaxID=7054 RepID=UPI001267823A|nr:uncharacterized protein LOC116162670 [Photinus pyralis]
MDFKLWSARGLNKELKAAKKQLIQQKFKQQMGLLVDVVKQGFGTTNDGNTARRFFREYEKSAEITNLDQNLLKRHPVRIRHRLAAGSPCTDSREKGVPPSLVALSASFFRDRLAAVTLANETVEREVQRGCPQGSCSGPVLWKAIYDGIFEVQLPEGITMTGYADDTMLVVRSRQYKDLKRKGNNALAALDGWARTNNLKFAAEKSDVVFFGKRPQQRGPSFRLGGGWIRCRDSIKTHTTRHLQDTIRHKQDRRSRKINVGHTSTGARNNPRGSNTAGDDVRSRDLERKMRSQGKPETTQRTEDAGRQSSTRAYRTVSTEAALVLANVLPIDVLIRETVRREWAKRGEGRRAARTGLPGRAAERRALPSELGHPGKAARKWSVVEGEESAARLRIYTDGSRIGILTECQYADGSTQADGKAGVAMVAYRGQRELATKKTRLGDGSSAFQCEVFGIKEALQHAVDRGARETSILSDSKSALTAIAGAARPTELVLDARRKLGEARDVGISVTLHWIKGHAGNERADELAKSAATDDELPIAYDKIPIARVKNKLREKSLQHWEQQWATAETGRLTFKFVPTIQIRREMVPQPLSPQLTQLLTGHGNFGVYLESIGRREDTECECGADREDPAHVLLECPTEGAHRGLADARLTRAGLRWPRTLEDVTLLAGEKEWWAELAQFSRKVERPRPTTRGEAR